MLIENFLKEVSKYCIVCGSYARGTQTEYSDIDFYIKRRPEEIIDFEMNEFGEAEETYIKDIIEVADKYNLEWTSVILGHIAVEVQPGIPIMLEFSYHYKIPKTSPIKEVEIFGIKFESAVDDKDCCIEYCINYGEF